MCNISPMLRHRRDISIALIYQDRPRTGPILWGPDFRYLAYHHVMPAKGRNRRPSTGEQPEPGDCIQYMY